MDFSGSAAAERGNWMISASSAPCGNASSSTAGRRRRSRPSASFMAIRDSQVDRLESPRKLSRCVKART
jgi:hypothetical protein